MFVTAKLEETRPQETRDGFRFRGGSLPLDLPATLAGRVSGNHREALATPNDLDRWLVAAGLAEDPSGATAEDLSAARDLRDLPDTQAEQRAAIIQWRIGLAVLARRVDFSLPGDLQAAGRGEIAPSPSGS